jgi:hypothetical protein
MSRQAEFPRPVLGGENRRAVLHNLQNLPNVERDLENPLDPEKIQRVY